MLLFSYDRDTYHLCIASEDNATIMAGRVCVCACMCVSCQSHLQYAH